MIFSVQCYICILIYFNSCVHCDYVHPTGGVDILFLLFPASTICRFAWVPVISRKSIYPIVTKFGMGVYGVNSLHGIVFGEDSFIANRVIAT